MEYPDLSDLIPEVEYLDFDEILTDEDYEN
jgi:hypothetical protein